MFENPRMKARRRSVVTNLCLGVLGSVFAQHPMATLDLAPGPTAQLDVLVSAGNAPAPNAIVIAADEGLDHVSSAKTDLDGKAVLLVPPGRYRVSASLDGHRSQFTVVAVDDAAVNIQLALNPSDPFALIPPGSGVVSGRVVAMNGEPVPYARVALRQEYAPLWSRAFSLPGRRPTGCIP